MYYAKGLRELIFETELSFEFYESLDEFTLACIENCFEKALEENMGMMNEIGSYNLDLLEEYKAQFSDHVYFVDFDESQKKKKPAA